MLAGRWTEVELSSFEIGGNIPNEEIVRLLRREASGLEAVYYNTSIFQIIFAWINADTYIYVPPRPIPRTNIFPTKLENADSMFRKSGSIDTTLNFIFSDMTLYPQDISCKKKLL
jgi:hypothetical protein